ncbi:MAG TPA: hypothetical protein VI451_15270 [Anaerolineales bacterium]|nr:hypothetical protein [Anaerolineales bacterium]
MVHRSLNQMMNVLRAACREGQVHTKPLVSLAGQPERAWMLAMATLTDNQGFAPPGRHRLLHIQPVSHAPYRLQ